MLLITKLLNFVVITAIASSRLEGVAGSNELDDDTSLKQALFLVELLKSDFAQVLRTNAKNDLNLLSTEDVNSTCALDDTNSTVAMNEPVVTESGTPSNTSAASTPIENQPTSPPAPDPVTVTPPGMQMMQFSRWPPLPMPGFPMPPGPARQGNFPDENYRFPYRFNRRRMMPDYYYFDSPGKSPGQFRRLNNNDPPIDSSNATATSQVKTTTNISSTATAENTNMSPSLSTTTAQSNTSNLTTNSSTTVPATTQLNLTFTEQSSAPIGVASVPLTAEKLIIPPAKNAIRPIDDKLLISTAEKSSLKEAEKSILATAQKSIPHSRNETSTQKRTEILNPLTKPRNRVGVKTRVPVSKARGVVTPNRNEKLINIKGHLRQLKNTTEENPIENVEMAQMALELKKEYDGTKIEQILKKVHTTTSTMKIFLQGSSRLPVPLPENNAFCYFHPNNALCGTL